jgi:Kdo2-lipid IVA lauroyltransferase/acyltransferase
MIWQRVTAWRAQWRTLTAAARSPKEKWRFLGEYVGWRVWSTILGCFPIETNLATARLIGKIWWRIDRKHRDLALDHLRFALASDYDERQLRRIARRAFQHFAQLYLVEVMLTPRIVSEWSWARHVELGNLGDTLREILGDRGTIMVTPHFGNYELMGFTVAKLGLPMTAVMRPLDNPLVTDELTASRAAGGLTLLHKKGASENAESILRQGGTLSFIADQDAGRKGVFAPFFNKRASWYKSIGLLALSLRVPIVVGVAPRIAKGFRYRIEVERIIQPEEWEAQPNPLQWVTETYAAALEHAIRRHPEQYLWLHRRWKSRPPDER